MTTHRLRAAPIVILLLSFAIVFGLGRLVGPAPDVDVAGETEMGSTPTGTAPSSYVAAPPADEPTTLTSSPPESTASTSPNPCPPASDAKQKSAGGVQAEPDETGHVCLGVVRADSRFPGSSLEPSIIRTAGGALQVCVTTPEDHRVDGWQQHDPPSGNRYCTEIEPGSPVELDVVSL